MRTLQIAEEFGNTCVEAESIESLANEMMPTFALWADEYNQRNDDGSKTAESIRAEFVKSTEKLNQI